MPDSDGTSLARLARMLLDEAGRLGADRAELLRISGVPERALADPDARIPNGWIAGLWMAIARTVQGDDVGIRMASTKALRDFGLVGYAMLHSATLGEAFERFRRFHRIVADRRAVRLSEGDGRVTVALERSPSLDVLRHPAEAVAARLVSAARELTGVAIVPAEVRLPHDEGPRTAAHRETFGSRVAYGSNDVAVAFHAGDARRAVVAADHELGAYLEALAGRTLRELPSRTSFVEAVRRAIWDRSDGTVAGLAEVATVLSIGSRSLQRRLREEGTTFQSVRDEVRRAMANRLLAGADLSVQEIAYLLGYADSSAFHRAFRRWEGVGPARFREAARERDGIAGAEAT